MVEFADVVEIVELVDVAELLDVAEFADVVRVPGSEFHRRSACFSIPKTHDENSKSNWKPPGQAVSKFLFDF